MREEDLDQLLSAMAHSGRRRMLDLLIAAPGISIKALASHFEMSRVAVLKHVRVLEEAQLVLSRKEGRTRQLFFNSVPIQELHDRWTTKYSAFWSERLVDLKSRVEGRAENRENHKSA
jgi:DNA-binding transcriptional ArsR family regulator